MLKTQFPDHSPGLRHCKDQRLSLGKVILHAEVILNFTTHEPSGTVRLFSCTAASQLQGGERGENIWLYTGCLNEISQQYFFNLKEGNEDRWENAEEVQLLRMHLTEIFTNHHFLSTIFFFACWDKPFQRAAVEWSAFYNTTETLPSQILSENSEGTKSIKEKGLLSTVR